MKKAKVDTLIHEELADKLAIMRMEKPIDFAHILTDLKSLSTSAGAPDPSLGDDLYARRIGKKYWLLYRTESNAVHVMQLVEN